MSGPSTGRLSSDRGCERKAKAIHSCMFWQFNYYINTQYTDYAVSILQKKAVGDVLLHEVYSHVGLEEMDYFGLQFYDKHEQMVSMRVSIDLWCKLNVD